MTFKQCFLTAILVTGLFLGDCRATAQGAAPGHVLKIAVVCADAGGRDAGQVTALLEAGLTGGIAFGLVERQAVNQVLQEQTLQSLSDSAGAAKFGSLVGADLLLFCQDVEGSKPPLMRLRVVETADGVILLDELEELRSLTDDPGRFRQSIEAAVKKAGIPVDERKVVGIVDVSSEEPGKSLDPVAATLGVLLQVDLAKSDGVVVLEREQLRHLTAERGLSGMEVKLRASTQLLEVKLRRAGGEHAGEELEMTASVNDMSDGKARIVNLSGPRDGLPAMRRELLEGILKTLAVPLPARAAGDIRAEAMAFHDRSEMLLLHGYVKEALPLSETAYTLDPQNRYFDTIARCCHDIYNNVTPLLGDDKAFGFTHVGTADELNAALLLAQMHLDASGRLAASIPADMSDPKDLHWGPLFTDFDNLRPMFPLPDPPQTAEQKMVQQLLQITDREYRLWSDTYRAHHWSLDALDYLTVILGPYLVRDGMEYCRRAQAAYEEFQQEQVAWLGKKTRHAPMYPDISVMFIDLLRSGRLGNVTIKDVRPLLIWLTKQDDPLLCVQGWNALAQLQGETGGAHAAEQVADALFRAKPLFASPEDVFYDGSQADLYRKKFFGDIIPRSFLPPSYAYYSMYRLYDDNRLGAYATGLLDELEKRGDPLPLLRWTRQTCELLRLEPKDDLAVSLRMQRLLESRPVPPEYAQNLGIIENNLKDRIQVCRQRLGLLAAKSNRWDSVTVREIKYLGVPAGAPRLIWVSVDRTLKDPDLLMLWRSDPINEHDDRADFTLVVARLALAGGRITEVARGTFSGPVYHFYGDLRGFRITSVLPTPVGIFIADFRRGLLVVRDGRITAWTEKDGLASEDIWSQAWAGNTLYAGADNGFMTIDPQTAKCRIIASGKAPTSTDKPFDGGTPYRIANILPSPDDKTLWLSVGGDFTRMGVWRYDMASGIYQQIVRVSDHDPELPVSLSTGPSLTWHDGNLLITMRSAGRFLQTPMGVLDARTGLWLKTYDGQRASNAKVGDSFPDERDVQKVYKPIAYTPQHRAALTSIGLIRADGDAVDPDRDKGFYYNRHLEEPVDPGEVQVSIRNSRIATPELSREWKMIDEVGPGFVAASYGDSDDPPVLWYLTPPKELPPPPVAEFERQ